MEDKDLNFFVGEARRSGLSGASAQRFFEYSGLSGNDLSSAMSSLPQPIEQENFIPIEETSIEQENAEPVVEDGFKPLDEESLDFFGSDLNQINSEIIGKSESEGVDFLRNKYNRYGFQFDESVPGFDFVKVTAPNGKNQTFNFKPGLPFDEDPNDPFSKAFAYNPEKAKKEANELVAFMNQNMIQDANKVNDLAKSYYNTTPAFSSSEEAKKASELMEEKTKAFQQRLSDFEELSSGRKKPDSVVSLRDMKQDLQNDLEVMKGEIESFQSEVGRYQALKKEEGNFLGALYNETLSGLDDIIKGGAGTLSDVIINIEESDPKIRDARQKAAKKNINSTNVFDDVFGAKSTSEEYTAAVYENSVIGGSLLGLARSIPAFVVPGSSTGRLLALSSQVMTQVDQEMSGEAFEGITENEKYKAKLPIAITVGLLERFGFRNIKNLGGLAASFTAKALQGGAKNLTAKTFREIVEQDIKSAIARGTLTAGGAFASEAETGLLQEVSSDAIKRVWNASKGANNFEVADSMNEYFKQIAMAALQEGIGGFAMGAPSVYRNAKNSFSDKDMIQIDSFRDPFGAALTVRKIKADLAAGNTTNEEATQQIEAVKEMQEIVSKIPSDASLSTKKQLFRKFQRERAITSAVKNKGGSMNSKEAKEVKSIQAETKAILDKYEALTNEEIKKEYTDALKDPEGGNESVEAEDGSGNKVETNSESVSQEEKLQNETIEEAELDEAAPTAEVAVEEGAEVELEVTTTDKKGRTSKFFKTTTEKDGVKTTRFTFSRSDRSPEQRSKSRTTPVEEALGGLYEFEVPEGLQERGVVAVAVTEVRESESGAAATVVFEQDGQRFEDEVVLTPKTQEAERAESFDESVVEDVEAAIEDDLTDLEDDFAEINISEATTENLASEESGFDTQTASVVGRVVDALKGNEGLKGGKVYQHNTEGSLRKTAAKAQGDEKGVAPIPLMRNEKVYGYVVPNKDGTRDIHLLSGAVLTSLNNAPSTIDLVVEEVITHYALEALMVNNTFRQGLYDRIIELSRKDPSIKALVDERNEEYADFSKADREEEVIAGFFIEYSRNPNKYRSIWQRIADFINQFIGRDQSISMKEIENEADLMRFAQAVKNLSDGRKTSIDSSPSQASSQRTRTAFSKKRFTYLENTTVYYDFDRQSGVEYQDWATPPKPISKKIYVNDYNHFRNWYNKITGNGMHGGIVKDMFFIKDGKKHNVKPPKPKLNRDGSLVEMDRIPTRLDIKKAEKRERLEEDTEMRYQYSDFSTEVADLWRNSPLYAYTSFQSFIPSGDPYGERDFEGLVIAKRNIQALIDYGITKDDLEKMVSYNDSGIRKQYYPDFFNPLGLSRSSEAQEQGFTYSLEGRGLMFLKNTVGSDASQADKKEKWSPRNPKYPDYGHLLKYDPAGSVDFTFENKELGIKETYKTVGGVSEIELIQNLPGGEGASISHGTEEMREKTLSRLKYIHVVINSTDAELEELHKSRYNELLKKADGIDSKQIKKKTAAKNKAKEELEKAEGFIEEAKLMRKQVNEDGGDISFTIHLNKPDSLGGRPDIFSSMIDYAFKVAEKSSDEFKEKFMIAVNKALNSTTEIGSRRNQEYFSFYRTSAREDGGAGFYDLQGQPMAGVKQLENGKIKVTSLSAAKDIMMAIGTKGNFIHRDQFFRILPFYQSERDAIFNSLPNIKKDLWPKVIEPYYWDRLKESFLSSSYSTAGIAYSAIVVNVNEVFNSDGSAKRFNAGKSSPNFPYFIKGFKKVVNFEEPLIIGEEAKNDAPKAVYLTYIESAPFSELTEGRKSEFKNKETGKVVSKKRTIPELRKRLEESPGGKLAEKIEKLTKRPPIGGEIRKLSIPESFQRAVKEGEIKFSKATGRLSKKLIESAGPKGVSTNQILQVMGKASIAEKSVLQELVSTFPDLKNIPEEDFDRFFEGKMLEPLDDLKNHSEYGLERVLGSSYRKAKSVTVPFLGDSEIYGTPGIFEDHFRFPTHAHIRMFTHPDSPGVTYVSELQSDTYQRGLKDAFNDDLTDEIIVSDYGSDEFDISVENLDLLKYIIDNYSQYRSMLIDAAGSSQNARMPKFWSDISESIESVSEKNLTKKPNVANILSNALQNNPDFNVNAFRVILRQYATSELNAPVNSTDKQIEAVIDDRFNRYPFIQEGEETNLGRFAKDVSITVDHISDIISDIILGDDIESMTQEERSEAYNRVVKAVEDNRSKNEREIKEGISSAKKSWEKQLIRYAIKKSQGDGSRVVRFPTEGTAATIQWWSEGDTDNQVPLRKRYRDLPKTLKSMGLESKITEDERGNKWYEVEAPPSDQRFMMFSKSNKRDNLGDIGGATWEMTSQDAMDDFADKWLVRFQDKYRRVFKLQEDVAKGKKGQVLKSQDFKMAEELMYGKAANDLEKTEEATALISSQLKELNITIDQLDDYMYNLHAKERNAVIRERTEGKNDSGSGRTDKQVDNYFLSITDSQKEKLESAAELVRVIQQDTRDAMVELGLETRDTVEAFEKMFSDYVPLQGRAKDEEDLIYSPYPNGGTGFSVSGSATKRAKGRGNETSNIVAQIISQNAAVKIKGRTNEALNSLYNLVTSNPNMEVWEVLDKEVDEYKNDDPHIVSVRVNGVQKAIRFKDPTYAQSLRSMNLPQRNHFVKMMGSLNSWLRAAFTSRNPEFILSNFSRDIQSAVFNASAEAEIEGGFLNGTAAMSRIFKMVGPSLKALVRSEVGASTNPLIMRYYSDFKADGGKTGWAYQKSLEDIASDLQINDDSGKTNAQKILGGAVGGVKGALEFVEGMNDAFENSIRLSSYIAAREAGVSREKAAQFAKNITVNFNKQGEWGAAVNATFLFFNASVQGSARVLRSLANPKAIDKPDGSKREWYERANTAQKAALGMVLMNGLLTLLNRAASEEDEDGTLFYSKIPDYVKERNLIIMRPDGKNYFKIPMPYGYNIFANLGSTSVEVASGDKQALEGLMFFANSAINAFSPVSFGQSTNIGTQIAKTSIPTAFKPFFEAFAFNETYFGAPVKAEQYPFGTPKPNSSMSFRSPEELKQFFRYMNEVTGGSENVPGYIDVNPDGSWYIFEYFLGGTGRFVTRSFETGRKIASDSVEDPVSLDFNDIPFARIVYGEPSKFYDMQMFKDREVEIKQLSSEFKNNRIPEAGDRYKNIYPLNEALKDINKSLRGLRKQKTEAKKIKDYSERVSRIQSIQEKERVLVMKFNKLYEELRGEN